MITSPFCGVSDKDPGQRKSAGPSQMENSPKIIHQITSYYRQPSGRSAEMPKQENSALLDVQKPLPLLDKHRDFRPMPVTFKETYFQHSI